METSTPDLSDRDVLLLILRLRVALRKGRLQEAADVQQKLSAIGIEVRSIQALVAESEGEE